MHFYRQPLFKKGGISTNGFCSSVREVLSFICLWCWSQGELVGKVNTLRRSRWCSSMCTYDGQCDTYFILSATPTALRFIAGSFLRSTCIERVLEETWFLCACAFYHQMYGHRCTSSPQLIVSCCYALPSLDTNCVALLLRAIYILN